jgi:hypothetical protein
MGYKIQNDKLVKTPVARKKHTEVYTNSVIAFLTPLNLRFAIAL